MAGADATLVLTDASLEDAARAAISTLGLAPAQWFLEPARDFPGQLLAIDLHGWDDDSLAEVVAAVRAVLERDLGVHDVPTDDEYEQRLPEDI